MSGVHVFVIVDISLISTLLHSLVGSSTVIFLMIRRPPRSTQSRSSAASDVYKRQPTNCTSTLTGRTRYLSKVPWIISLSSRAMRPKKIEYRLTLTMYSPYSIIKSPTVQLPTVPNLQDTMLICACLLYTSPSPRDS